MNSKIIPTNNVIFALKFKKFMKKFVIIFLSLFITCATYAQLDLLTFENSLKKQNYMVRNIVPIVNKKNDHINLLFIDKKQIYSYLVSDHFQIIDRLKLDKKNRKFNTIVGSSISKDNDYRIFLTNKKKKKFISIHFSYKNKQSTISEINLDLGKELFVQSVNYNNNFYLITVQKKLTKLNIYKFNDDLTYKKQILDLSLYKFVIEDKFRKVNIYNALSKEEGFSRSIQVYKFDENTPNSLEATSKLVKMYLRDNELVFSFDHTKHVSQFLTINLDNYKHHFSNFKTPYIASETQFIKKSNSFLSEDKVYQLATTSEEMVFTIKNYNTEEVIKSYKAKKTDSISFKNSRITQKGGSYAGHREFEKTKKYLRKLSYADVGVAVYKNQDEYQVTLGGNKEIQQGGGMMMPMGFAGIPIGAIGGMSLYFNPTMFAYSSYSRTKSTYINCKFDTDFNHLKGEIKKNPFDIISLFKKKKRIPQTGEIIFKYKNYYILGHYFGGHNLYHLTKFE